MDPEVLKEFKRGSCGDCAFYEVSAKLAQLFQRCLREIEDRQLRPGDHISLPEAFCAQMS